MSHNDQAIRGVSMALRQLVLGWDRYREAVAGELGVGTTEVVTLGYLYYDGPLTPRDIGERLNLTSGSVTALLDRLVSSGFVTRSQHPDDRRSLLASATPAGRHAAQWLFERLDEIVATELERVPELPIDAFDQFTIAIGDALTAHARAARE